MCEKSCVEQRYADLSLPIFLVGQPWYSNRGGWVPHRGLPWEAAVLHRSWS